jgi:hypothetical protein
MNKEWNQKDILKINHIKPHQEVIRPKLSRTIWEDRSKMKMNIEDTNQEFSSEMNILLRRLTSLSRKWKQESEEKRLESMSNSIDRNFKLDLRV